MWKPLLFSPAQSPSWTGFFNEDLRSLFLPLGKKRVANPEAWKVRDGRFYLNLDENIQSNSEPFCTPGVRTRMSCEVRQYTHHAARGESDQQVDCLALIDPAIGQGIESRVSAATAASRTSLSDSD
jgi:hypothetical protein